jgi:beta-glucosidase
MTPPSSESVIEYTEGLAVGWLGLIGRSVLFAFGSGLSYSSFSLLWEGGAAAQPKQAGLQSTVLRVRVTNVGGPVGRAVAQLYLAAPSSSAPELSGTSKPSIRLRGFAKTGRLESGASELLTFALTERDLSFWREGSGWEREVGTFTALVGQSSRGPFVQHTFEAR